VIDPPVWLRRRVNPLGRFYARLVIDRPLNRVRRDLGLPPVRDLLFKESLGGVVNLGLWSPRFRPPASDDPPDGVICGYCPFDRAPGAEHAPADLERFLDECAAAHDPPVIVTLGSSVVHHAGLLYRRAAEACRRLGRRGLLLTASPGGARDLLPGVRAFGYAPYRSVFPHAGAIVHHGGAGTTGSALGAGKPTVVIPFANDEFDNASRVRRLGTSLTVRTRQATGRHLARALAEVLQDPIRLRAAQVGSAVAEEAGPATAADSLEAALSRSRRVDS
jgi:UDP:flavonoid glycosyltransferase YjiC (YdhE family)